MRKNGGLHKGTGALLDIKAISAGLSSLIDNHAHVTYTASEHVATCESSERLRKVLRFREKREKPVMYLRVLIIILSIVYIHSHLHGWELVDGRAARAPV